MPVSARSTYPHSHVRASSRYSSVRFTSPAATSTAPIRAPSRADTSTAQSRCSALIRPSATSTSPIRMSVPTVVMIRASWER
ncbi:hypothetical protein [Pseudonocardia halophobica]|uniref:hypothetical protein n=1 Tax=Pseudonocardia halophobica TaxID=29401 RepID=UPI000560274B|nr:hypothetical protein [Pseudonocardia halophobica]